MAAPTRPLVTIEARGAPHAADANQTRGVFTTAQSRTFTQALTQPGTASFDFRYYAPDGSESHELAMIDPTNTDILFWLDTDTGPQCLFRGRLCDVQLASQQSTRDVLVHCQVRDYKNLLQSRFILDADCDKVTTPAGGPGPLQRNYAASVDLGSIVWDVISLTQAKSHGTYGITSSGDGVPVSPTAMTRFTPITVPSQGTAANFGWHGGSGTTGITLRNVLEVPLGTSIYSVIDGSLAIGNQGTYDFGSGPIGTQGFEWDIVPDPSSAALKLHIWPKTASDGRGRGADQRWVLDRDMLAGFTTDWSTDQLATMVRIATNGWTYDRVIDVSSTSLGRWEKQVSLPEQFPPNFPYQFIGQPGRDTIDKAAADAFFIDTVIRFAYTVTLPPATDPTGQLSMALGDTARLQMPSLFGITDEVQRIVGRTVTITDNGDVTVSLSVGKLPLFTVGAQARAQRLLSAKFERLLNSVGGGTFAP